MSPQQALTNFKIYCALVGAAYVLHEGEARRHAILRAWSNYASPLLALLTDRNADPCSREVAMHLTNWLKWLHDLPDPEAIFQATVQRYRQQTVGAISDSRFPPQS